MIGLWLALARADEPQPRTSEEVTIYGEILVEQARRAVDRELRDAGYDEVLQREGRTIYRHSAPHMGQVVIDEEGWMRFARQPVRVEAPGFGIVGDGSPVAWVGCVIWSPLCVRPGGQLVSRRRLQGAEWKVVGRVHDDVETWNERIADLATERKVDGLPERLDALWTHGTPLEPGQPVLVTPAARRQALLAYWSTRTETPWGEAVRASVEAFCRAVVQRSDYPFTDMEIAAFNASPTAPRPFSLVHDAAP